MPFYAAYKYVYSYLLKEMKIERCNQTWEMDITHVPMGLQFRIIMNGKGRALDNIYSERRKLFAKKRGRKFRSNFYEIH